MCLLYSQFTCQFEKPPADTCSWPLVRVQDSWVGFIPFDLEGDLDEPGDIAKDKEAFSRRAWRRGFLKARHPLLHVFSID